MNSPNGTTIWGYLFQCLSLGGSGGISSLHFPQTASAYTALDNSGFFTLAVLTGVPPTCQSYRLPPPSALQSSPGGAPSPTVPFFSVNAMFSITLSSLSSSSLGSESLAMRKGHLAQLSSVSLHSSTHRNGKLTPPSRPLLSHLSSQCRG